MKTYRLSIPMWATGYVDVEVPDEIVASGDAEAIHEYVMENARLPQVCAQCSGWGHQKSFIELSDEGDWDKAEVEER